MNKKNGSRLKFTLKGDDALAKMEEHTGRTLAKHAGGVYCVASSPDGSLVVSASNDNKLKFSEGDGSGAIRLVRKCPRCL